MRRRFRWGLAVPLLLFSTLVGLAGCGTWENLQDPEGPVNGEAEE